MKRLLHRLMPTRGRALEHTQCVARIHYELCITRLLRIHSTWSSFCSDGLSDFSFWVSPQILAFVRKCFLFPETITLRGDLSGSAQRIDITSVYLAGWFSQWSCWMLNRAREIDELSGSREIKAKGPRAFVRVLSWLKSVHFWYDRGPVSEYGSILNGDQEKWKRTLILRFSVWWVLPFMVKLGKSMGFPQRAISYGYASWLLPYELTSQFRKFIFGQLTNFYVASYLWATHFGRGRQQKQHVGHLSLF